MYPPCNIKSNAKLRIGAVKTTMLICLSKAFLLTSPPDATWLPDDTITTLSKDARLATYKRAEEIVKQAFARQPSYDDLVPALLKLGVDKLATECTMRVGVPIKPMLGNITKDLNDMAKILEGRAFTCEFKYLSQMNIDIDMMDNERKFIYLRLAKFRYSQDI
jgi:DNA ligase 1